MSGRKIVVRKYKYLHSSYPKFSKENSKSVVYWLRSKNHKDITKQGYIGVTLDLKQRIGQHLSHCKNGTKKSLYEGKFKEALLTENFVLSVVCIANTEYCLEIERKLRPKSKIGWNKAIGNNGGFDYKHGMTKTPEYRVWCSFKHRAERYGIKLCEEWCGDGGAENFIKFYRENVKDGSCVSLFGVETASPETVGVVSRKELVSLCKRNRDFLNDGELRTIEELGYLFNIKPNTISTRLKRNWSVEEALGLMKRKKKSVKISGEDYVYSGSLSKKDLLKIKKGLYNGKSTIQLAKELGIDASQISRLSRRFNMVSRPKVKDFLGGYLTIQPNSKLKEKDYKYIIKSLEEGKTQTSIAKFLGMTTSGVNDAVKRLKWKEYRKRKK